MGFFSSFIKPQLPDVVEWDQIDPKLIFWRWPHQEIKKGSKLIIRPGQDAVFLFNGQIEGVFTKDAELRGLVGLEQPTLTTAASAPVPAASVAAEATDALLSMGFSPQEAELALEGHEEAGATTIEKALSYALKRLGGGR